MLCINGFTQSVTAARLKGKSVQFAPRRSSRLFSQTFHNVWCGYHAWTRHRPSTPAPQASGRPNKAGSHMVTCLRSRYHGSSGWSMQLQINRLLTNSATACHVTRRVRLSVSFSPLSSSSPSLSLSSSPPCPPYYPFVFLSCSSTATTLSAPLARWGSAPVWCTSTALTTISRVLA